MRKNLSNLRCDKCGSLDIEIYIEGGITPEMVKQKTMSSWGKEPTNQQTHAIYIFHTEIAKCKKCGFKVKRLR